MSVLSRLTAASYWLCLQVCVTNKTLVSIDQLLSSLFLFFLTCHSLCGFNNVWISWLPLLGWEAEMDAQFSAWCHGVFFFFWFVLLLIICCHHVVRQKTALVLLEFLQNSLVHTIEQQTINRPHWSLCEQTKAPDDICACFKAVLCHKRSLESL